MYHWKEKKSNNILAIRCSWWVFILPVVKSYDYFQEKQNKNYTKKYNNNTTNSMYYVKCPSQCVRENKKIKQCELMLEINTLFITYPEYFGLLFVVSKFLIPLWMVSSHQINFCLFDLLLNYSFDKMNTKQNTSNLPSFD